MDFSLWRDLRGYFAVCRGNGLSATQGYIIPQSDGGWRIEGDESAKLFLDEHTAASVVLKTELPAGIHYYEIKRGGEIALVATYPEAMEHLQEEGWTIITKSGSF